MFFKLAWKNIKKSYKDYTIYFLTLIIGVCIFYSFNSIGAQEVFSDLKFLKGDYISKLTEIMSIVSVLVSIILGGLILYANNYLIKKRKRELGIYMTLGIGKRKISTMLVIETFIVGIVSLIIGLIFGIIISQALASLTLKLFNIGLDKYMFTISLSGIIKTIEYFGVMFTFVIALNIFIISKYEIIDLLTVGRKNEKIKFKKPSVYALIFIVSIMSIGISYILILENGLNFRDSKFLLSIVFLIIGTITFFGSLSGIVIYILNKDNKMYFKGLNIFLVKQINSKINTNFIAMSIICLMLFITIIVLSTGISVNREREAKVNNETPFDASIIVANGSEKENLKIVLDKINFKMSNKEKYINYNEYNSGIKANTLIEKEGGDYNIEPAFIKLSDYNKILELRGKKEISLNKREVLLVSNYKSLIKSFDESIKVNNEINIKGKKYIVKNNEVLYGNIETNFMPNKFLTIIIDDEFLNDYKKINRSILSVMYLGNDREENNKIYNKIEQNVIRGRYIDLNLPNLYSYSKDNVYLMNMRKTIAILFVGIYLGLIFLITSMAILAIQQLSEASDSIERYKSLKRIGATEKMIDKTIFIQTLIYFSLPVILAISHAIIGILVVNKELNSVNPIDIKSSALITVLVFLMVYICYFYTTYLSYKNIVKNNI